MLTTRHSFMCLCRMQSGSMPGFSKTRLGLDLAIRDINRTCCAQLTSKFLGSSICSRPIQTATLSESLLDGSDSSRHERRCLAVLGFNKGQKKCLLAQLVVF